ncbi:MAG: hypothetical protein Kow0068_10100 [Marinilabiliales bacterium]
MGLLILPRIISEVTGIKPHRVVYQFLRNEQDIYLPAMIDAVLFKNFITQQHTRATQPNLKILNDYKIRPIILVRNIFDVVISLRDYLLIAAKMPMAFVTEDFFYKIKPKPNKIKINVPVVIMAGGKGTRMKPFTDVLPKPLIPIGNKTMIEIIMDEYNKHGIKEFYLSINYKGKLIKAYFEDFKEYIIHFIEEEQFLGTAGSLKLLNGKIHTPFFVSNCDILIKGSYADIYNFHNNGNYDLTIVAAMVNYKIPYGVCKINKGGALKSIEEKPEYNFLINTGMYVLNPKILNYIPNNQFYNITNLINILKNTDHKIGVYPVSEGSYIDTGQWEQYKKANSIFLSNL